MSLYDACKTVLTLSTVRSINWHLDRTGGYLTHSLHNLHNFGPAHWTKVMEVMDLKEEASKLHLKQSMASSDYIGGGDSDHRRLQASQLWTHIARIDQPYWT